jgi:AbrB family looped-hinge helix DNA binding protein
MEAYVRVKHKGQITLPATIRSELTLKEGDLLRVTVEGKRIMLEPAIQAHAVAVPFDGRRLKGLIGAFRLGGDAVADTQRYDD